MTDVCSVVNATYPSSAAVSVVPAGGATHLLDIATVPVKRVAIASGSVSRGRFLVIGQNFDTSVSVSVMINNQLELPLARVAMNFYVLLTRATSLKPCDSYFFTAKDASGRIVGRFPTRDAITFNCGGRSGVDNSSI